MRDGKGFALIELAVLIIVIAILAVIALPSYQDYAKYNKVKLNYATVTVFYATDRNKNNVSDVSKMFGSDRGELSYGTCDVSIPRDHRMGELESPSVFRFEFREDPEKHVVLLGISVKQTPAYFNALAQKIRSSAKKSALIFIHGYNVTFEDAARRTAQMTYDLAFDGAPIFYSWPSRGKTSAYPVDETNIEWSKTNIKQFLARVIKQSGADNIYLIAHSMGNRALTWAMGSLFTENPEMKTRVKEIILTAPDIDADVFRRDIAPQIAVGQPPVTLYASSEDKALQLSKTFHGYARAGDSGRGLIVTRGIETIDATNVDTSFIGHSYFAEERSVISDMFYLIREGKRPDKRFALAPVDTNQGRYWAFKK